MSSNAIGFNVMHILYNVMHHNLIYGMHITLYCHVVAMHRRHNDYSIVLQSYDYIIDIGKNKMVDNIQRMPTMTSYRTIGKNSWPQKMYLLKQAINLTYHKLPIISYPQLHG